MKRNENLVPKFDEIIFENRNKDYGAFDLRRRYKTVTSLSIIGSVFLSSALIIVFAFNSPDEVKAKDQQRVFILIQPDILREPEKIIEPELKKPEIKESVSRYVAPKVVDDTTGFSEMIATGLAIDSFQNGEVTTTIDTTDYESVAPVIPEEIEPLVFVEEQPMFPGGNNELLSFIAKNLHYPQDAIDNGVQGRVFVKFAVWTDGSVKRIQILKGIDPLLDEEAIRVISTLPLWKPGRQNGNPVPVWFTVPVTFQLLLK